MQTYSFGLYICEGQCFDTHPFSKVYTNATQNFTLFN